MIYQSIVGGGTPHQNASNDMEKNCLKMEVQNSVGCKHQKVWAVLGTLQTKFSGGGGTLTPEPRT